jgi:autophagy-related protein 9
MMASNLISRLLPSASDEPLEGFPARRPSTTQHTKSPSHRDDMDIDEENLEARFEAQDLENLLADASTSHMTTESTAFLPATEDHKAHSQPSTNTHNRPTSWREPAPTQTTPMYDDDDDVPESLLLEGSPTVNPTEPNRRRAAPDGLPPPVPGPSTRQTRAQWDATRRHQRLHEENQGVAPTLGWGALARHGHLAVDPKQKALWLWVNVSDLDAFLVEVYGYYTGCGIYSILLRRLLTLLQVL